MCLKTNTLSYQTDKSKIVNLNLKFIEEFVRTSTLTGSIALEAQVYWGMVV